MSPCRCARTAPGNAGGRARTWGWFVPSRADPPWGCRQVSSLWLVLLCSLELGLELLERFVLFADVPVAFAGDREAAPEQQHPTGRGGDQAAGEPERPPITTEALWV